jgi:hypothetical protein
MQTKENKTDQESHTLASQQKKEATREDASNRPGRVQNPYVAMQRKRLENMFGPAIQREEKPEEEKPLQGMFVSQLQPEEEEEPVQGKFVSQLQSEEEEEPVQGKFPTQLKPNNTGLPDEVKSKMETSLNSDFSDVRMHPDSSKATEVGALAYTQGSDIHFAPGQFKPGSPDGHQLIGHELSHVIQQREGRVQPTIEVAGMPVNDNPALEQEADTMGARTTG